MEKSRICLALLEPTIEANINQALRFKYMIDMVELRADYLDRYQMTYIYRFPEFVNMPVILTFRRKSDGGKFEGSDIERLGLMKQAITGKYTYVDLESDVHNPELERILKTKGIRVIRSLHDFRGVPDNLTATLESLAAVPGEIPKLAVMPQSTADLLKIVQCARDAKVKEKILLGMGDYGFPTRILATKLDSFLTYCSVPGNNAAPGHVDPVTLETTYRFKTISPATRVFGIIANPVMHTLSPVIHNSGYTKLNLDAVYVPFRVDSIDEFIKLIPLLDIRGFSVTIPYKEQIIPYLAGKDKVVNTIGACNTVVKTSSGLQGSNTDAAGFIAPLKQLVQKPLAGLKATVIGAGGSAKAVVYALTKEKVQVLIINRTLARAEQLAITHNAQFAALDAAGLSLMEQYSDLIVQTTSVGMEPDEDHDPVPEYQFKGHEIVYELIYKPLATVFLDRAEDAGCKIISGLDMLHEQAYAQFLTFTGQEYPVDKE